VRTKLDRLPASPVEGTVTGLAVSAADRLATFAGSFLRKDFIGIATRIVANMPSMSVYPMIKTKRHDLHAPCYSNARAGKSASRAVGNTRALGPRSG